MKINKKAINYYSSFFEVSKELTQKQFYEFNMAIYEVMFFEKHINDVEFKDQLLTILWKSVKHSIEASVQGYCTKKSIPYDECFTPLDNPLTNPLDNKNNEQEQEKEQEQEQVQYVVGQSHDNVSNHHAKTNPKIINEIIAHLNQVANTHYKPNTKKTKDAIKARLNEGFTLDDFKQVHIIKYSEWVGTDFEKFIRPETLYSNKFEGYLNQKTTDYQKLKAINNHTGISALDMLKQQGYA